MRTNYYNRQARRAALCIRRRAPRHPVALSRRGLVLTAYGHDLARLAVSIADELELSPEVTAHILAVGTSAKPASTGVC